MADHARHLVTVDDLSLDDVHALLLRAAEIEAGGVTHLQPFGSVVGLLFLSSSLRTRAGFATAAARLGGGVVDVYEPRYSSGMSAAESVQDSLRTLSGMTDMVVMRSATPAVELGLPHNCPGPFINAGDATNDHPSQSLIDLWAIESERGPVGDLTVAIVGDLTTRVARSLLRLFCRLQPGQLLLISPESRQSHGIDLPRTLALRTQAGAMTDLSAVDVIYVSGLAPGTGTDRITKEQRAQFSISTDQLNQTTDATIVLSPMPVIDEITFAARRDPRVRLWGPSDRSVAMRTALLEFMLAG